MNDALPRGPLPRTSPSIFAFPAATVSSQDLQISSSGKKKCRKSALHAARRLWEEKELGLNGRAEAPARGCQVDEAFVALRQPAGRHKLSASSSSSVDVCPEGTLVGNTSHLCGLSCLTLLHVLQICHRRREGWGRRVGGRLSSSPLFFFFPFSSPAPKGSKEAICRAFNSDAEESRQLSTTISRGGSRSLS